MSIEEFLQEDVPLEIKDNPSQLAKHLSDLFNIYKKWWSEYDDKIISTIARPIKRCIELLEKSDKPTNEADRMKILAVYKIGCITIDKYFDGVSAGRSIGLLEGKYKYEHSVFR